MGFSDTLEFKIIKSLNQAGKTVGTAESCTGGLIAFRLTNIPGASTCFNGGIVAYSNPIKAKHLDVKKETLEKYGAVSEQTAREMAEGARKCLDTAYAISVTGIAGPTGGTEDKPVGLVYIGLACHGEETQVEKNLFHGTREEIKDLTADKALNMLWEKIR